MFIAINIETFVFNFRHFESMTFSHNYLKYEVDENSNTIEIKNINKEINNIYSQKNNKKYNKEFHF